VLIDKVLLELSVVRTKVARQNVTISNFAGTNTVRTSDI
jgi:hypothetical protein